MISTVPDAKRRGFNVIGSGRDTPLPASSSAHAVIGAASGRFHGSANRETEKPLSPTAYPGKNSGPTLTPAFDAPLARMMARPPPPWCRYCVAPSTSSVGGVNFKVTGTLAIG